LPQLPVARPDSAGKGADMSDPIERLRRKAQNEATALALNEALHLAETEIKRLCAERAVARSRAEYWKAEHLACNAENEKLRAAGVGYSQQTVDALSSERDRLRAALIAAMEIVQQERTRLALADSRAFRIVLKRIAELDAIIAQADAALGREA
jgi:hypothetical protein